ncbi:MAG: PIN-like domain-containing protein [Oceanicaulis sp.]
MVPKMISRSERSALRAAEAVKAVMERRVEVPVLGAFLESLDEQSQVSPVEEALICFDTNVLLDWAGSGSTNVTDYLSSVHKYPIVIPGQVLQEFWNNQFSAIQSTPREVKKKFDDFAQAIENIDGSLEWGREGVERALSHLSERYPYLLSGRAAKNVEALFRASS